MSDHGYVILGKYSAARDSILHFLVSNEWGNASTGNVEAPTGWFARISNAPGDVNLHNTEITSVLSDWFEQNPEVTDSSNLRFELVGHFLVREDSNGFVSVTEYSSESELIAEYQRLENEFSEWDAQD